MSRGKIVVQDFIQTTTPDPTTTDSDPTNKYNSAVDVGQDFSPSTTPSDFGKEGDSTLDS